MENLTCDACTGYLVGLEGPEYLTEATSDPHHAVGRNLYSSREISH